MLGCCVAAASAIGRAPAMRTAAMVAQVASGGAMRVLTGSKSGQEALLAGSQLRCCNYRLDYNHTTSSRQQATSSSALPCCRAVLAQFLLRHFEGLTDCLHYQVKNSRSLLHCLLLLLRPAIRALLLSLPLPPPRWGPVRRKLYVFTTLPSLQLPAACSRRRHRQLDKRGR